MSFTGYVSIKLTDQLLKKEEIDYFNSHRKDFKKLNEKEVIIVPFNVFNEIGKYVAVRVLQHVDPPIIIEPIKIPKKLSKKESMRISARIGENFSANYNPSGDTLSLETK